MKRWLPSKTPESKQKKTDVPACSSKPEQVVSRKRWLPSKTPESKRSKVDGSACSQSASVVSLASMRSSGSAGVVETGSPRENLIWTCSKCQTRVEASSGKSLSASRYNHLQSRHPGWEKGIDLIRKLVPVVKTSKQLPVEQRDWTCVWCGEGLPLLGRWQFEKSVTAHLKDKHPKRMRKSAADANQQCNWQKVPQR